MWRKLTQRALAPVLLTTTPVNGWVRLLCFHLTKPPNGYFVPTVNLSMNHEPFCSAGLLCLRAFLYPNLTIAPQNLKCVACRCVFHKISNPIWMVSAFVMNGKFFGKSSKAIPQTCLYFGWCFGIGNIYIYIINIFFMLKPIFNSHHKFWGCCEQFLSIFPSTNLTFFPYIIDLHQHIKPIKIRKCCPNCILCVYFDELKIDRTQGERWDGHWANDPSQNRSRVA